VAANATERSMRPWWEVAGRAERADPPHSCGRAGEMITRVVGLILSLMVGALSAWVCVLAASVYYLEPIAGREQWRPFTYFEPTYKVLFAVFGLIVGFTAASFIYRQAVALARDVLSNLQRMPGRDKAAVVLGIFIGLGMTALLGVLLVRIPHFGAQLTVLVGLISVYLGVFITLSMKEELYFFFPNLATQTGSAGRGEEKPKAQPKLLDTNVIIDGRISDVARAGFVEGPICVPGFVLEELHMIADSSDTLKRNRGRRGLDILNQMQQERELEVTVVDQYSSPIRSSDPVDAKLVQLAKELGAAIITNDFNLNKVAQLQGIRVMNVNELANAVKPVVLPGEELTVTIVREGKEPDQGVAYLDDGTMVVVERGKDRIGETLRIIVTSVLQTVAGKMIFGNPGSAGESAAEVASAASRQRAENRRRRM
jgi:uncharacterized protein YacL